MIKELQNFSSNMNVKLKKSKKAKEKSAKKKRLEQEE